MIRSAHAATWISRARRWLALAVGLLSLPLAASASHRDGFVFTFEQGDEAPEDWCSMPGLGACFLGGTPLTAFDTSSWSGRYLGSFGDESIYLTGMDYLGGSAIFANRAYLSFDLILTGDWGGNGVLPNQPDFESVFNVVANGSALLNTSFASEPSVLQAYPGSYPQGSYPAGTGAATFATSPEFFSVYHFDFMFSLGLPPNATCCADVMVEFSSSFGPVFDRIPADFLPRWGLDNVVVSSTPIPEPASGALLGLGLLVLGARRRRA